MQTKNLTVPKFNIFAQLSTCSEIPDYKYCQELITDNISNNKIMASIANEYQRRVFPDSVKETKNFSIFDYLKIGGIVLVILGIIGMIVYIIVRQIRKKRII